MVTGKKRRTVVTGKVKLAGVVTAQEKGIAPRKTAFLSWAVAVLVITLESFMMIEGGALKRLGVPITMKKWIREEGEEKSGTITTATDQGT